MKVLRIGAKVTFLFILCVILSVIIGAVAIVNINRITGNITKIKICKDIEIEILECRRQEKNILLLGPYEKSTLEEKEEKTYLEKSNDNLTALRELMGEAKKRIPVVTGELKAITVELDKYKIFLEKVEDNFKERKSIIENLEITFKGLQELLQIQDNMSKKTAPNIFDVHVQTHHYILYRNHEYINKAKSDILTLKKVVGDEKIILLFDEYLSLSNYLIKNTEAIKTDILGMRKSGRIIQRMAVEIRGAVEKKIYAIEKTTILTVRMTIFLAVLFISAVGVFFIRSITNPIRKLAIATTVFAKGDLSHRVVIESTDEIGELARSFNEMAEDLQKITVSKEYVESIIGNMVCGLIVFSPDGKIKRVNKATCGLLGYKEEEIVGMHAKQLFERETSFEGAKLSKLVETGYLKNYELICLSKDKVNIPIQFNASIMRDPKGEVFGIIGVLKDMRELKKLQERLVHVESLAALGRFSSIIGHEFKNELCAMKNTVYFLGMKLQDGDEKVKKYIRMLDEEIAESVKIIDNITSLAKNRPPEFKSVNLEGLLSGTIDKLQILDTIKVVVKIEKDLPSVQADRVQLERIFNNIILNALQAMREKDSLIIKASRSDDSVNIVFEDTGFGIKEEDRKMIFDPFFSTKPSGMGLGLAISKIIIAAHNGSIDVASKVGKGTTVTIRLPLGESKNA